jgi:hypothetical protein
MVLTGDTVRPKEYRLAEESSTVDPNSYSALRETA